MMGCFRLEGCIFSCVGPRAGLGPSLIAAEMTLKARHQSKKKEGSELLKTEQSRAAAVEVEVAHRP